MNNVYTKTIRRTLSKTVYYSGNVSYPSSESGGSKPYNGSKTVDIDVEINVHLDNDPVFRSVNSCENHVNGLTASIVAMEAAEIKAKRDSSKKVATSIIRGFFGLIKSEISQQIEELKIKAESQLLYLKETTKSCLAKKKQMEKDVDRIEERYNKIFSDLDTELDNRIHQLDKHIFTIKKSLSSQLSKVTGDGSSSVFTVSGADQSKLESNLLASNTKKKTFEIIDLIKENLITQKKTDVIFEENSFKSSEEKQLYMPVCYAVYDDGSCHQKTFSAVQMKAAHIKKIDAHFASNETKWNPISKGHNLKLSSYIAKEVNARLDHTDKNYNRLLDTFSRIATLDSLLTN